MHSPSSDRPRISIIIPVYNGEDYLAEAIESIRSQRVGPLEILVVDDGSTDRTRRLAEESGSDVRYHFQENAGPAAARNAGLQMARGDVIGFLDADDMFAQGGLGLLDARLAGAPCLDAVMGTVRALRRQDARDEATRFEPSGEPVVCYNVGSILARRAVFERVGAFDTGYLHCEDVDWFMRAQEHRIAIEVLGDVVLLYRRHEKSMSRDAVRGAHDLTRVLKASIDRRRKLAGSEPSPLDGIYYVRPGRLRM